MNSDERIRDRVEEEAHLKVDIETALYQVICLYSSICGRMLALHAVGRSWMLGRVIP